MHISVSGTIAPDAVSTLHTTVAGLNIPGFNTETILKRESTVLSTL